MPLEDHLRRRILEALPDLRAKGKLLARDVLERGYATFRRTFGPEVLAGLDGEALLSRMHEHGRTDSLVYWLEFKNDDELPAVFGSIAGGSALKFGIYRRKETGAWMVGPAMKQRALPIDEAVAIARRNRDQLVAGTKLLDALPRDPGQVDYERLQGALEAAAPDLAETAWGHKYFSLVAYQLLDDYHAVQWQRFHLLKLLIEPPEGRYRSAAHLARLAQGLDLLPGELTGTLNQLDGDPHRWIRLGTTDGDTGRSQWEAMRDGSYAAVGWNKVGDLSAMSVDAESRDAIKKLLATHYPTDARAIGNAAGQIFDLVVKANPRDVIVAMRGARHVVGVGRIIGGYEYAPTESEFAHRRKVEWISDREWELPEDEPVPSTVRDLKRTANIFAVEREIAERPQSTGSVNKPVTPMEPLSPVVARIEAGLRRRGQIILYGPPGTGKTHHAEEAAQELAARSRLGRSWRTLDAAERRTLADDGVIETCCFHPAYGYEDFIEGYRPVARGGTLAFDLRDGVFKRLCARASAQLEREYFLIIDEINRGDVPRIFGELLTVLEKSRRGRPITLPVSGSAFSIPPNVFVIGTMNTADRSIALLDAALRRRFAFLELMPRGDVLGTALVRGIPLGPWLDALNQRVRKYVGRDSRNLQIGHTYFLDVGGPIRDFVRFRHVLRDEIVPLLEEYCYDRPDALCDILGDALYDASRAGLKTELFESGAEDALVQALLKPAPEVTASKAALDGETADDEVEEP
ncbi:MAG: AAA family ATPase [Deltaproteobacteria bacterium]|nr:AAA family ATPase [Deltaproteobacteria bacterium]